MNASTGSVVSGKIREAPGIISMAVSSSTENTMVTYSPSGTLTYYNLRNGQQSAKFDVSFGLEQPVLFNNNVFFAGVTNDGISVVQATTGKEALFVSAKSPLLLCSRFDRDLYYLEFDGKIYSLKVLENLDNNTVAAPKTVKNISRLSASEAIVCGTKAGNEIVLGSKSGQIYKITADALPENKMASFYPLTDNMYDKIFDISQAGESFYFLTRNSVFKSSYDNSLVEKVASNSNQTNMITYNDNLILWSRNSRNAVQLVNIESQTVSNLFVPEKKLQSLRLFGNTLISLEGNSSVKKYDLTGRKIEKLYEGSGLQDAVLYDENMLYIAKSAATNPPSPFIFVDTVTKEVVPIDMKGNVAYSLNCEAGSRGIYGIRVAEYSGNSKTELFTFNPETKNSSIIFSINDEDPNAFIKLYQNFIYTNIGKDQIMSYNSQTRRQLHFKRSASLPLKIERNSDRLVILNRDGSISWYNPSLASVIVDWYMTTEGQWYEF